MGLTGSWVGFPDVDKQRLLGLLGLEESGETGDFFAIARPFSLGEMPNGSLVVYSSDIGWADPARVLKLSLIGSAVGCQFSDTVMVSYCSGALDGAGLWTVSHEPEQGLYDLQVSGEPPSDFETIRKQAIAEQDAEGGENAGVDFLFEVPLLLAKQICGFKYDDESGATSFKSLRTIEGGWAERQLSKMASSSEGVGTDRQLPKMAWPLSLKLLLWAWLIVFVMVAVGTANP